MRKTRQQAGRIGVVLFATLFAGSLLAGSLVGQKPDIDDLTRAASLLQENRYQEVLDLLQPGLTAENPDPRRLRLLGRAAMGLARPAGAVDYFQSAASRDGATAQDHANLAWARYEQAAAEPQSGLARAGFLDAAVAAKAAVARDAGLLMGWQFLTAALERAEQIDEATAAYESGLKSLSPPARTFRLAFAAFLARHEKAEPALAALKPLLDANPDDAEVRLAEARIRAETGRLDLAADILRQILENHPDHAATYQEIWTRFNPKKQRDRGIALLEAVVKRHPENLTALGYLGNLHLLAGDFRKAEAAYQRCLEVKPDHAWAHRALGELYRKEGFAALGQPALNRKSIRNRLTLSARSYLRYYDYAAAQKTLDRSTIHDMDLVLYHLARDGLDPIEAYKGFTMFLRHFPEEYSLYHTLGLICQDLGKFQEGETAIRRAIQGCPEDQTDLLAAYVTNLGLLFEGWNKYVEARKCYESAAQLTGKGRLDALENLGKLAYKLGDPEEALGHFKAVLDESPDRFESLFYYHLCRRWVERESHFRKR